MTPNRAITMLVATAILLTIGAAPAVADGDNTARFLLEWEAPDTGRYLYSVFQDGELVHQTTGLNHTASVVIDQVTSTGSGRFEVRAASLVQQRSGGGDPEDPPTQSGEVVNDSLIFVYDTGDICRVLLVHVLPNSIPPIGYDIDENCLP